MEESTKINWTTPIAIIIAGLLIAGAIFYKDSQPAQISPGSEYDLEAARPINLKTDHIRGDINAPITIIEYSDLECPFCKIFHQTMLTIYEKYGQAGKVAWVYRHFPLDKPNASGQVLHAKAGPEADATECAALLGGNEAFWKLNDKIFAITPSNDGLDLNILPTLAKEIGLNETRFKACLNDKAIADKVEADYQNGIDVGVSGTPFAIMINNVTKERIVILSEDPTPNNWDTNAKDIRSDILKYWVENLNKARGGN